MSIFSPVHKILFVLNIINNKLFQEIFGVFRHFCQIDATVHLNRKCTLEASMWCIVFTMMSCLL